MTLNDVLVLGFIQNLGMPEMMLILGLGVLLFGSRLPSIGRSVGKSIVEFKKGLRGIEDDIDKAIDQSNQADMLPPPEKTTTKTAE